MEKPRAALWLWYDGGRFAGFQRQAGAHTVQQAISLALARAGAREVAMGAGRTDKGVHARMQVVSVRTSPDEAAALTFPGDEDALGVAQAVPCAPSFHAQWSAVARTYRYRLALGKEVPSGWAPYVWHLGAEKKVDVTRLSEAVALLRGTRTFEAFHKKSSVTRARTLHEAHVHSGPDGLVEVTLCGDGFGRHQVRELLGACCQVATGASHLDALTSALGDPGSQTRQDRAHLHLRAPPSGLVLWEVHYPPEGDPFAALRRAPPAHLPGRPPFVGIG